VLGPPALWVLPVAFPLVMALGGLLGLLGVPIPGVEIGIAVLALVGGVVAVATLTAMLTLALSPPHPAWLRIGLRVAGSWIAASGLLVVGWLSKFSS
jgi:hydrogenase/urease accessory protein HupE